MRRMREYLSDPELIWVSLSNRGLFNWMSDEDYISRKYRYLTKKVLDLNNPISFNEKIQWLKLFDRNPLYIILVDKYEVKKYLATRIGEEHIIPTFAVWNRISEMDFSKLPQSFVIKATHDSGSVLIVRDKSTVDTKIIRKHFSKSLRRDYYCVGREWPYKNAKPRIIAEEYLVDESGTELKDYKVFNFNGEPRLIQVDFNRFVDHKRNIYDTEWNYIDMEIQYQSDQTHFIPKPKTLKKMLELARLLSKDIPFLRTDFYCVGDRIYLGEMTFYPGAGFERFKPEKWDYILGDWLRLDQLEKNVD